MRQPKSILTKFSTSLGITFLLFFGGFKVIDTCHKSVSNIVHQHTDSLKENLIQTLQSSGKSIPDPVKSSACITLAFFVFLTFSKFTKENRYPQVLGKNREFKDSIIRNRSPNFCIQISHLKLGIIRI